jgi:putative hydrolase of the HAD superfamily
MTSAVLFDVDFTLIYPGPTFQGEGYRTFCAAHGIAVDPSLFDQAVAAAARLLDGQESAAYDHDVYVGYTRRIIEGMGGTGDALDACAREIYREWAACRHFELYADVPAALRTLRARGIKVGLISNSHRCLATFETHFELTGLISAAVSSSEHGMMKPHPSIFAAALSLVDARPSDTLMVGDSVSHDVEGAMNAGMRAALLHRAAEPHARAEELAARGVPTLRTLDELAALIDAL